MLTDEEWAVLPEDAQEIGKRAGWDVNHPEYAILRDTSRAEQILRVMQGWATALLARQRDRKRLRRAAGLVLHWRDETRTWQRMNEWKRNESERCRLGWLREMTTRRTDRRRMRKVLCIGKYFRDAYLDSAGKKLGGWARMCLRVKGLEMQRKTDRKRLRRVLWRAKYYRDWKKRLIEAAMVRREKSVDRQRLRRVLVLAKRTRWSAAWKAAAKKWRAKHDVEVRAMIKMLAKRTEQRDFSQRKHIQEQARANELEAERDELQEEVLQLTHANGLMMGTNDKLMKQRDELQRQLKEVSDCILHYAPADFPILTYDSAAGALSALLEGEDDGLA